MNILILGSGGREHAFAWKISQSPECDSLFIAPGNAGTSQIGKNVNLKLNDFQSIKELVLNNNIQFVIVGPEDPLGLGIVDFFKGDIELKDILIFGPGAHGALLECSKDFAKLFMQRHNIPTAAYMTFDKTNRASAEEYILGHSLPIVMKADGLAAGKGVVICQSAKEALDFLGEIWDDEKFGEAGNKVVIEEFLTGIELSVFVITDGNNYIILPEAKDYKRIGEGDTGLNTGGMGTVSPVPFADKAFMTKVENKVIKPTVQGLINDEIPYKGFIFFGLINVKGEPFVIEYNVRMGDPETEVVLPRIKDDLLPILIDAAKAELKAKKLNITPEYAVCVMAVSGGYPGEYEKNKEIKGLDKRTNSMIFHAGTTSNGEKILSSGGRVLAIVSLGGSIAEAAAISYESLEGISFDKMNFRKDIGKDLIKYIK
jgi:phosphoribosylamine--glycine ligase